ARADTVAAAPSRHRHRQGLSRRVAGAHRLRPAARDLSAAQLHGRPAARHHRERQGRWRDRLPDIHPDRAAALHAGAGVLRDLPVPVDLERSAGRQGVPDRCHRRDDGHDQPDRRVARHPRRQLGDPGHRGFRVDRRAAGRLLCDAALSCSRPAGRLGEIGAAARAAGEETMATLKLTKVTKAYGNIEILHGIDLDIESGEFIVFVGPSGCGKSTLLRTIAGLEQITSGTLEIDGVVVNDIPLSQRRIAMVFQSYALYPHMSDYDNMAIGTPLARNSRQDIDGRVKDAANILQLTPY